VAGWPCRTGTESGGRVAEFDSAGRSVNGSLGLLVSDRTVMASFEVLTDPEVSDYSPLVVDLRRPVSC
jgi:hypothetical protein